MKNSARRPINELFKARGGWVLLYLIVQVIRAMVSKLSDRSIFRVFCKLSDASVIHSSRGSKNVNLKERTYLWYIALLRIYIGYYFLQQGIRKFQRDFPRGDWIGRQIGDLATIDLYPWYKKFLVDYVVPHHELFGYFVMTGEILVGACLVLGLLTRLGACVGLFLVINYYLGIGVARGGATLAQQQTFIVCLIIIILSNPGRTLGLDGLLFSARGRGG